MDVNPNLYMKFDASVTGAFYGGFKYEYEKTFKAGITHSNGFKGYGSTGSAKGKPSVRSKAKTDNRYPF